MVRLRIKEILAEQGKTKYWLNKQLGLSYQNLSKIMNNETSSVRFETLEALSNVLNCSVGDLFIKTND
jgi:putative transcriptional regulator